MSEISVKMRMPAVRKAFTASYSEVERPTGVQTILLLHIGSPSTRGMTLFDAMKKMDIHMDIVESIMVPAIEEMIEAGMIEGPEPYINVPLSRYDFTPAGRQAFDMGVMATRVEPFRGEVVYRPGAVGEKYSAYRPSGFTHADSPGRGFEGLEADIQRIENEVCGNKDRYGVPKDAEVFDVEADGPSELLRYEDSLKLTLNEASGDMMIFGGGIDANFLKSAFRAEDILAGASPAVFSPRGGSIRARSWREWNADMSGRFMLPWDLSADPGKSVVLSDPGTCSVDGSIAVKGLGADIVVIESQSIAREYLLVDRDVSVAGFEGSRRMHLVVCRTTDAGTDEGKERLASLIEKALATLPPPSDVAGLKAVVRVAALLPDATRASDIVAGYIPRDSDPVPAMKEIIAAFGREKWFSALLDSILEDALVGRSSSDVRDILMRLDRKVPGRRIVDDRLAAESDRLVVMDNLCDVVTTPRLAKECGEGLADRIVSGDLPELASSKLIDANRASTALSEIRTELSIASPRDAVDYVALYTSGDFGDVDRSISTFSKAVDGLGKTFEDVSTSKELGAYRALFDGMAEGFSDTQDRRKMPARVFGINMVIAADGALRSITGSGFDEKHSDMLEEAKRSGAIGDALHGDLDDLRRFRNLCAHEPVIPALSKADRARYIRAVEDLEEIAKARESTGDEAGESP